MALIYGLTTDALHLAVQVETGEVPFLPLSLRRNQQELKYAVNVKTNKDLGAKSVTWFHRITLSKKFKPNNLPVYSKTLEYFLDACIEPVNPPAVPDEPPWHVKACSVVTSLINYLRQGGYVIVVVCLSVCLSVC